MEFVTTGSAAGQQAPRCGRCCGFADALDTGGERGAAAEAAWGLAGERADRDRRVPHEFHACAPLDVTESSV
jgi:hypothetical protein